MRQVFCTMAAFVMVVSVASAQVNPTGDEEKAMKTLSESDSGWTVQGTLNLGTNLSLFSNWAAGGINSLGVNTLFNGVANYRQGKQAWDNQLILAYGLLNQGFATSDAWVKTDDRIDFTSKYGRKMSSNLYYAALLNFQTQFSQGFATGDDGRMNRKAPISNFMAPGKLLLALGVDYKPTSDLSIFFSPLTYRGIFVYDQLLADQGAYGVEKAVYDETTGALITPGENIRNEFGAYLRVNYEKKFSEKFTYTSILELFSNYLDKPGNIDVNWQNIAAWKMSKNFSLTFMWQALYDDNTTIYKNRDIMVADPLNPTGPEIKQRETYASKGVQLRSVLTVGFVQNF